MENLPPLPEPSFELVWLADRAIYKVTKPNIGDTDVYTADQMREYARQAVAALEQREPVGEMVGHHLVGFGEMPTIRWRDGYWPKVGTKLYTSPPTSAYAVDAERYRWIKSQYRCMSPHIDGLHDWAPVGMAVQRLRGPSFDAAIDAAIAATKEKA